MLYDCWRQIARKNPNAVALRDSVTTRQWTFSQLGADAESASKPDSLIAFPQGIGPEFILAVLRAWRFNQILCPLESGQSPPVNLAGVPAKDLFLPSGIVHLKTTSASTGAARIVALTAAQLKADADNIVATMGLRPDWPNLGVISLAHSYGFSNLITPLLLHGIPLILVPSPLPESLRQAAAKESAITLAAVPALWRIWHDAGEIPANTKLAISAGAPLPLQLEQAAFESSGVKIHNFLGASECGGIAYDASTSPRTDAACVGHPMDNVQLSVNENNCLQVRGPAVAETYWAEADAALGNGCFQTSDLAELKEGFVYLRGRASDQINVAGRKISPEIIERALLAHPDVKECLVFGAPSGNAGRSETIVACVASERKLDSETLKQFLLSTLPAWQIPREWSFVDSLEANRRGKLSRADWRKKYLAGRQ